MHAFASFTIPFFLKSTNKLTPAHPSQVSTGVLLVIPCMASALAGGWMCQQQPLPCAGADSACLGRRAQGAPGRNQLHCFVIVLVLCCCVRSLLSLLLSWLCVVWFFFSFLVSLCYIVEAPVVYRTALCCTYSLFWGCSLSFQTYQWVYGKALPLAAIQGALWMFTYSLPFIPAQTAITTVLQQSGHTIFYDKTSGLNYVQ